MPKPAPSRPANSRQPRIAAAALLLFAVLAGAARADVEDLSPVSRRSMEQPATWVLRAEGGTNLSPFGNAGASISWLSHAADLELEAGAGAGFPGLQLGFALRKLFGERGDFFVSEIALGYNQRLNRGADPLAPGTGAHVWLGLGIGLEHRAGWLDLSVTGGLAFPGVTQTPVGYARAGVGVGLF